MILRGFGLQMAIQLVAEERLTEIEIATRLNLSLGSLFKLYRDQIFIRRVEQVRATLVLDGPLKVGWSVPKVVSRRAPISEGATARTPVCGSSDSDSSSRYRVNGSPGALVPTIEQTQPSLPFQPDVTA